MASSSSSWSGSLSLSRRAATLASISGDVASCHVFGAVASFALDWWLKGGISRDCWRMALMWWSTSEISLAWTCWVNSIGCSWVLGAVLLGLAVLG